MKTIFKTTDEMIKDEKECPFPLGVIPDKMGINLISVEGISWQKQDDGQLTSLTIHFIPEGDTKITARDIYVIDQIFKLLAKNEKIKKYEVEKKEHQWVLYINVKYRMETETGKINELLEMVKAYDVND